MSEADRWRICPHPSLVPHPTPELMPTLRTDLSTSVRWVSSEKMSNPPDLRRCILCGQVGELATPNV